MKKRKILVLADSPTVPTGFGQVSRNVLKELHATGKYEIDMIGINYDGSFDREEFLNKYPYLNKLVPAHRPNSADMYGREFMIQALAGRVKELTPPWDIIFTIQDHFIIEAVSKETGYGFAESIKQIQKNTIMSKHRKNSFVWVGYFPVDGNLKSNWVDNAIAKADFPVAYCEFGKNEILKHDSKENQLAERINVIKHGTNTEDFYMLPNKKELRDKYFGKIIDEDSYLIINVNRNQMRKDLLRTLLTYKEFKKRVPKAFLYLHCNPHDVGGNLFDMARGIGLDVNDFAVPVSFNERSGIPIEQLNEIYNCADAMLTTTLGEGWGLSITESMATKVPVFAPNITSVPEILNTHKGFDPKISRGFAFNSGKGVNDVVCFGAQDNEVVRPISDIEDAVEKMVWAYEHPEETKQIVERAYKWASELTWKKENEKWLEVFEQACQVNDKLREEPTGDNKLGRNDKCPMCKEQGIDIKIKKCSKHKDIFI